jgi:dephospho-CoA kinase
MPPSKETRSKPVIGLAGGIGSGKSTVARLFGALSCLVIDSDALSHEALQTPLVKQELRAWLGETVFDPDGSVNRKRVAAKVFAEPAAAQRLAGLIHPEVARKREQFTAEAMANPAIKAVIWDSPLLFEAGLNLQCDAVVFVHVPRESRINRLAAGRGWDAQELDKRENLQFSLDKKGELADYCIDNSGDEASTLRQVRHVLSQILTSLV